MTTSSDLTGRHVKYFFENVERSKVDSCMTPTRDIKAKHF